jgi:hypothetical protein
MVTSTVPKILELTSCTRVELANTYYANVREKHGYYEAKFKVERWTNCDRTRFKLDLHVSVHQTNIIIVQKG